MLIFKYSVPKLLLQNILAFFHFSCSNFKTLFPKVYANIKDQLLHIYIS